MEVYILNVSQTMYYNYDSVVNLLQAGLYETTRTLSVIAYAMNDSALNNVLML